MQNLENKFEMSLDQFDKLEQNIKKSIKQLFELKLENNKLRKEVELLKKKLETRSERGIEKLNNSNSDSTKRETFPKDKSEKIASQLDEVLKKMRSFTTGVEF
jgi:regulator of replication initiation timing